MKKQSIRQKIQYYFDNLMSKGTIALIGLLFGACTILVVIIGVLAAFVDAESGMIGQIWISFMHTLDPGTLSGNDMNNIPYLALMTLATLCGIFLTSILIGIISAGFENKIKQLRKGTSKVLEEGHTLILGFNDNIYTLLNELIGANENKKDACIVVVGEQEKEEMEEAISSRIPDTKTTRIICRSGSLFEEHILERCSTETSKSIIVNVYEDSQVIKVVLAVSAYLKDKELLYPNLYITAAIKDMQNVEAAKIAGEGRVEAIFVNDAISRIIAHTCRQPGLYNVLVELFDYDGDELYFETVPEAYGLKFKEILNLFENAVVFGIHNETGTYLNPPMDTVIQETDQIILFEDDDGAYTVNKQTPLICEDAISVEGAEYKLVKNTDNLLVLGNNNMLSGILKEYDCYVAKNTSVVVVTKDELNFEMSDFRNINLHQIVGDATSRKLLCDLLADKSENVLILSNNEMDAEEADAQTLLQLIYLWDISRSNEKTFAITSEMRKTTNQRLATQARVDDFVIGSNIVNLLMTQIAENRDLAALFEDILDEDGSELYMKPAVDYVKPGVPVDFYTITESAARKGHIAIGYKKLVDGENVIVTNPPKTDKVTFTTNDVLIVVAEE